NRKAARARMPDRYYQNPLTSLRRCGSAPARVHVRAAHWHANDNARRSSSALAACSIALSMYPNPRSANKKAASKLSPGPIFPTRYGVDCVCLRLIYSGHRIKPEDSMFSSMFSHVKAWAQNLKRDSVAIYLASRDPRTPWYAKAIAVAVAAYAFSPIDLI